MAEYTLSYNSLNKGWPSFYSYKPDFIIGMNSYLYTFDGGNLYRHNTHVSRNNYYGSPYSSTVTGVLNDRPLEIKLFKTMSYESNTTSTDSRQARWEATSLATDLSGGSMLSSYFEQKEGEWFSYVRNNENLVNFQLRSAHGIGVCTVVTNPSTAACVIEFSQPPGYIISIGDETYATTTSIPPAVSPAPSAIGPIRDVNNTTVPYSITIDQSGIPTPPVPVVGELIMYYKNPVAESAGARGYYMEFKLTNSSTSPVELFSVSGSVMKSFP